MTVCVLYTYINMYIIRTCNFRYASITDYVITVTPRKGLAVCSIVHTPFFRGGARGCRGTRLFSKLPGAIFYLTHQDPFRNPSCTVLRMRVRVRSYNIACIIYIIIHGAHAAVETQLLKY